MPEYQSCTLPGALHSVVAVIALRNWSRLVWFLANLVVVSILLSIRLTLSARGTVAARQSDERRRHGTGRSPRGNSRRPVEG
jgi:hypothetical protein